jgi:hypothetical protein
MKVELKFLTNSNNYYVTKNFFRDSHPLQQDKEVKNEKEQAISQ